MRKLHGGIFGLSAALAIVSSASAEVVGPATLEIDSDARGCILRWRLGDKAGDAPLNMTPPCEFHRGSDGQIRLLKTSVSTHLLIESSRPNPQLPRACMTSVRGVAISQRSVRISTHISKVVVCPPFNWDEQMFTGLF